MGNGKHVFQIRCYRTCSSIAVLPTRPALIYCEGRSIDVMIDCDFVLACLKCLIAYSLALLAPNNNPPNFSFVPVYLPLAIGFQQYYRVCTDIG